MASWRVAVTARSRMVALVDLALEEFPDLPVADRAHARHRGVEAVLLAQRLHLVDQPHAQHGVEALLDASMQQRAVGDQGDALELERQLGAARRPAARDSGLPVSFHTSSARWMRCASFGAMRCAAAGSTLRQLGVQRRPAALAPPRCRSRRARAHRPAAGRRGRRSARGSRASCRRPAAGIFFLLENLHDDADRVLAPSSRRVALVGIDDVDQVVRHLRAQLGARAWRCRCPCRGTPAPSRATRSRPAALPRA